jgi:hypothetical protein
MALSGVDAFGCGERRTPALPAMDDFFEHPAAEVGER